MSGEEKERKQPDHVEGMNAIVISRYLAAARKNTRQRTTQIPRLPSFRRIHRDLS